MAADYLVISQSTEVQVLSPTFVMDVEKVGIRTSPSGIYVEYPVPMRLWRENRGADVLGPIASGIEAMIAQGLAVGGSYVQDYDVNNLLVDFIDFIVEYQPPDARPPQRASVLIPLGVFTASEGDPWFAALAQSPNSLLIAAYDHLVAMANA